MQINYEAFVILGLFAYLIFSLSTSKNLFVKICIGGLIWASFFSFYATALRYRDAYVETVKDCIYSKKVYGPEAFKKEDLRAINE